MKTLFERICSIADTNPQLADKLFKARREELTADEQGRAQAYINIAKIVEGENNG